MFQGKENVKFRFPFLNKTNATSYKLKKYLIIVE